MATPHPSKPSSPPIPTTTSPSKDPPNTSSLPPKTLDLATKLFNLARTGSTPTLLSYLRAGIPHDLTNAQGDTLLMLAAYHGNVETTKMLLEEGADPNILNGRGQSIIAGAVFKGSDEVVEVLLEGGADVRGGRPSAVECARMFGREDLVERFEGGGMEGGVVRGGEGDEEENI